MTAPAPSHFKGKEVIEHVAEAQAQGILTSAEIHGTETPGRISAGADAARDCAIILLLAWTIFHHIGVPGHLMIYYLGILGLGVLIWKAGRSAWLGWSRLERMHRVLEQERWEIEHHRKQERDELGILYQAKGFEGKLLEDVLDVLMADGDRLLKVMVEEELGLSLSSYDHPLMQSLGAAIGSLVAIVGCLIGVLLGFQWGVLVCSLAVVSLGSSVAAYHASNKLIPAIVWNIGLTILSFGSVYFLLNYFFQKV